MHSMTTHVEEVREKARFELDAILLTFVLESTTFSHSTTHARGLKSLLSFDFFCSFGAFFVFFLNFHIRKECSFLE